MFNVKTFKFIIVVYTVPEPPPEEPDRKLWIIGVVFGAVIVFIGCCWCILFVYFKCTRPLPAKRSPRTPRSFRAEVYTNEGGSLTKAGFKPHEVKVKFHFQNMFRIEVWQKNIILPRKCLQNLDEVDVFISALCFDYT